MNQAIQRMLNQYTLESMNDYKNALAEIIQEIALLGLWRSKFFEHAAFYGGTALRILHKLDRFSEDMDFSLLEPDPSFNLSSYLGAIEREILSFGFSISIETRTKQKDSQIESAFIKGGTRTNLITIETPGKIINRFPANQKVKIKLEVDIKPPGGFSTEAHYLFNPIPFSVNTYSLPDLFAGKTHAVLCRNWKNRIKGRDWYDFVWLTAQKIPLNLHHLSLRMIQTGHLPKTQELTPKDFKKTMRKRIESLNIEAAQKDVRPFLNHQASIEIWSKDFFLKILDEINFAK